MSQFRLQSMRRVLRVQRSGYYAWKKAPKSKRTLVDESVYDHAETPIHDGLKYAHDNGNFFHWHLKALLMVNHCGDSSQSLVDT